MTPLSAAEAIMVERLIQASGDLPLVGFAEREKSEERSCLLVGEPGERLPSKLEGRYVTRIRLVPSEVLAYAGGTLTEGESEREVLVVEPRASSADRLPPELVSDRLTMSAYQGLLLRARELGYRFLSLGEALEMEPSDPARVILLRHDIDLSPARALRMAEVEATLGVRATYFFMLSGAFYDLLEPEHRRIVRRVAELGHDVGFHYDEHDDIAEGLDILSIVAGRPLQLIAQHNPTLLARRGLDGKAVLDAYDPRITGANHFVYVSDSGMKWREKTFADLLSERHPRIYALCHPESWLAGGRDMIEMIRWVEADEVRRRSRRYDAFVESNLRYLSVRRGREGR